MGCRSNLGLRTLITLDSSDGSLGDSIDWLYYFKGQQQLQGLFGVTQSTNEISPSY